jgi:ABC-type branched-subunit amino acid transport system permease subunit
MKRVELIGWAAAAVVLAGLPQLLSLFQTFQLTVFVIFAMLALSLDFLWGIAGILSFGQAALFGVGGYVYGIVGINWVPQSSPRSSATSPSTDGSDRCISP